jgi:hypothetical protein
VVTFQKHLCGNLNELKFKTRTMKNKLQTTIFCLSVCWFSQQSIAQINLLKDYVNNSSATIGTFQNIKFREGGFSSLYPIPNTNGKEYWTISDRGVNVDAANANPAGCHPSYDKIYGFPNYAPKIHRIKLSGDSIIILQTIAMKRPGGTNATGLLNPTGFGSTALEVVSTDTVLNCTAFNSKTAPKDIWGIDSEGIVVDNDGNFWICEEGGPTIWKLNPNGIVLKRFTPYANLAGAQPEDVQIDTVFKYRKNNRGFEGISITPNGKIYAIIQSPILFPDVTVGENTQVHRILEINPADNSTRMFVYLNEGIIGASGANQIRLRDWKIGDMAAINNNEFLVIEAGLRGTTDRKKIYKIDISAATAVTSGLYGGKTIEALVDSTGLFANGIVPVKKKLFLDLLANGWTPALDKSEGLAIINDSTIAVGNDNDYGQASPTANGIATATNTKSHVFVFGLKGTNKLVNYQLPLAPYQGITGVSSSQTPYLLPTVPNANFTSIISVGDATGGYKMCGIPDGLGAFDNGNGTFTLLMNHEISTAGVPPMPLGIVRAHGAAGAFVSKWVINKSDLSVVSGSDLIKNINLWNGTSYTLYNAANPSPLLFLNRFCSADLPSVSAYYNGKTGLGTEERIFMNGEESGNEGRAFGHIVTGLSGGTSYELPALGKFSRENSVACPVSADKTIVAGLDDSTPGQVYFYIGTKTNSGSDVEKAGLTNGKLFGVTVSNYIAETDGAMPAPNTAFTLFDLGDVRNKSGADLNTTSNNAGVTTFLRPEDGAWDPSNPSDFYFTTTNAVVNPSRLWKLHFTDIQQPESGGTITAVLDGTEGQKMLDNLTIDDYGHVLLVEDVGNNAHVGRVLQYDIATDKLITVGEHDKTRFLNGGANFLTQDEEASGILDVQSILGKGMFLVDVQAHYTIAGELVEGGQLLAYYNPDSYSSNPEISLLGNNILINDGDVTPSTLDNTHFGNVALGSTSTKEFTIQNAGPAILSISNIGFTGTNAAEFSLVGAPTFPATVPVAGNLKINVQFAPLSGGTREAFLNIWNNDSDEKNYDVKLEGEAIFISGIESQTLLSAIKIYPNPAGDVATIDMMLEKQENISIRVFDVQGKEIALSSKTNFSKGHQQINLNTSNLEDGVYYVEVLSETSANRIKIVVMH